MLKHAVEAAIRAPSMHNTQPWRFRIQEGALEVYADRTRTLPVADPRGWALRIACGAAVYNARLAFAAAGRPARVRLRPDPGQPDLLARLEPDTPRPATPAEWALYEAIGRRHSNRQPFAARPVPAEVRRELLHAATDEGARLDLLIGRGPLAAVAEVTRAADTALVRDPRYRAELAAWSRAGEADDGVPLAAGGPSPEPTDLLAMRDLGGRTRDLEAEPLVGLLSTIGDTVHDQLVAGQALQRVLLTATAYGLATSLLSQPIEVPEAREGLRRAVYPHGFPQMVLRVGYGQPGFPTRRRPVAEVLDA